MIISRPIVGLYYDKIVSKKAIFLLTLSLHNQLTFSLKLKCGQYPAIHTS